MSTFDDAANLIKHAEQELPKIAQAYQQSLQAQSISPTLLIEIKNFCENLRSALDFAATGLFERYGASKSARPKIYFPYATDKQSRSDFETSGRIEACVPGVSKSRPDIATTLLKMQHFSTSGHSWLPAFMELTNENKHQRLTPQTRKEQKELRISGQGASISLGRCRGPLDGEARRFYEKYGFIAFADVDDGLFLPTTSLAQLIH
jgi:hypothetical protein